jgi:hypothetical protein
MASREAAPDRPQETAKAGKPAVHERQGGLFSPGDLVLAELASLDIDGLTPLEALNKLAELRRSLKA